MKIKEQFKLPVYVCVILRKNNEILLVKRSNTGYADNNWGVPGGSLEEGETLIEGAVREIYEEVAAQVQPSDLKLAHILQFNEAQKKVIGFYFETRIWTGDLINNEPHKHEAIGWFNFDNLPSNLTPGAFHSLSEYKKGNVVSFVV